MTRGRPMKISLKSSGKFNKTEKYLRKLRTKDFTQILQKYGEQGVQALRDATPIDSGETANSWTYQIDHDANGQIAISWANTHFNKGVQIAVILQYGHGTGTGGYFKGRDYINPTMRPVFDKIAEDAWKEINS